MTSTPLAKRRSNAGTMRQAVASADKLKETFVLHAVSGVGVLSMAFVVLGETHSVTNPCSCLSLSSLIYLAFSWSLNYGS